MIFVYPATVQPEEDGRFSIWFDDLSGCATSGETLAEAMEIARDAMGLWISNTISHNEIIPNPSKISDISTQSDQFVTMVDMDLDAYRRGNEQRSIRKMVTLPVWLNARAERAGVNFSKIMQDALHSYLGINT